MPLVTRLSHSSCTGSNGIGRPRGIASRNRTISAAPVETTMKMTLRMFAYATLPSFMPLTMDAKLSSVRTMSALSFATSVPFRPMATPTCACLSAGASLTPSPVTATKWPVLASDRTMDSF
ncbi:hypothetical protein D3C72_1985150 [compost metagenome]